MVNLSDIRLNRMPRVCWEWVGPKNSDGYGVFKGKLVHRLMWEIIFDPIPVGMCVLHKCDNPPCINPCHLILGTKTDNAKHRKERNRSQLASIFTITDIKKIRERCNNGEDYRRVAEDYNTDSITIWRIWKLKNRLDAL